jgi:hypothetical protein
MCFQEITLCVSVNINFLFVKCDINAVKYGDIFLQVTFFTSMRRMYVLGPLGAGKRGSSAVQCSAVQCSAVQCKQGSRWRLDLRRSVLEEQSAHHGPSMQSGRWPVLLKIEPSKLQNHPSFKTFQASKPAKLQNENEA